MDRRIIVALVAILAIMFVAWNRQTPHVVERPQTPIGPSGLVDESVTPIASAPPKRGTEALGERSLPAVPSEVGILFIDGRYVRAPYRIRRVGTQIRVNDGVYMTINWPSRHYVEEDPPLPGGLDRNSRLTDLDALLPDGKSWVGRKLAYLSSHFPPEEIEGRFQDALLRLPMVKVAETRIEPDSGIESFRIETHTGESRLCLLEGRDFRPLPVEKVVERLEAEMRDIPEILAPGNFILHSSGGQLTVSRNTDAWWQLPEVFDVLEGKDDRELKLKKIAALLRLDPPAEDHLIFLGPLIVRHRPDPQLTERLKVIRDEREAVLRDEAPK